MEMTANGLKIEQMGLTRLPNGEVEGRIIIVHSPGSYMPWVTGLQMARDMEEDCGWIWGHYFKTLPEAQADFRRRIERGY